MGGKVTDFTQLHLSYTFWSFLSGTKHETT
nr:MAG TPA: hypothetical protein [Caudoviricetes sp.]